MPTIRISVAAAAAAAVVSACSASAFAMGAGAPAVRFLTASASHHEAPPTTPAKRQPTRSLRATATSSPDVTVSHNDAATTSVAGIADAVGTDGFALKVGTATVGVRVTTATQYFTPGGSPASLADIHPGERVAVAGTVVPANVAGVKMIDAARVYLNPPAAPPAVTPTTALPTPTTTPDPARVSVSGVADAVGADGFNLTVGATTIRVRVNAATVYYTVTPTPGPASFADIHPGEPVAVAGTLSPVTTSTVKMVDAIHVYINPPTPTTTPAPTTTSTTTVTQPRGTVEGELPPGGSVSALTPTSFVYTNGGTTVLVKLSASTLFYRNGVTVPASVLATTGVTVGTAGVADPTSTSTAKVIDAIRVYITTP